MCRVVRQTTSIRRYQHQVLWEVHADRGPDFDRAAGRKRAEHAADPDGYGGEV
jgi:hypothetical protein